MRSVISVLAQQDLAKEAIERQRYAEAAQIVQSLLEEQRRDARGFIDRLDKNVDELKLSARSRNCLAYMNIRTIGDLVQKTPAEMLLIKNLGKKSLNEIKKALDRSEGLRLGMRFDHGFLEYMRTLVLP